MSPQITLLHDPLRGRRSHASGEDRQETSKTLLTTVTLHTSRPVTAAWVRSEPDNEEVLSPLTLEGQKGRWFVYEGELRLNPADDVTLYAFKIVSEGSSQLWLSEYGQTPYFPERAGHFRYNPHYEPVPWLWSHVFHQIFSERFCDGDPSNNVVSGEYLYEGELVVAKARDALELDLTRLGLIDETLQSFFERETEGRLSLTLGPYRGRIFTL